MAHGVIGQKHEALGIVAINPLKWRKFARNRHELVPNASIQTILVGFPDLPPRLR
jgi:hypothetical protein